MFIEITLETGAKRIVNSTHILEIFTNDRNSTGRTTIIFQGGIMFVQESYAELKTQLIKE